MLTAHDKLEKDLDILEAMADGMADYLKSDILFGKLAFGDMPMLTLGGYLMRQHRLFNLSHLLTSPDAARLETAVFQFNQALVEKIVRLEAKANKELDARLRQVDEYLRDLQNKKAAGMNYATAVEPRAMIAALIHKLEMPPYHLDERIPQRVDLLDRNLRRRWSPGDFVWAEEWQPAYPLDEYWWLYGRPT
ncbi:MAG: hypothetical protein IPM39_13105 [Chloroflexi bacterium]|nr:hypothetical protein [Chloroflexota bacterium]